MKQGYVLIDGPSVAEKYIKVLKRLADDQEEEENENMEHGNNNDGSDVQFDDVSDKTDTEEYAQQYQYSQKF